MFEIELEKDVKLPIKYIRSALPDGGDGNYSIKRVYGMSEKFWDNQAKLLFPQNGKVTREEREKQKD